MPADADLFDAEPRVGAEGDDEDVGVHEEVGVAAGVVPSGKSYRCGVVTVPVVEGSWPWRAAAGGMTVGGFGSTGMPMDPTAAERAPLPCSPGNWTLEPEVVIPRDTGDPFGRGFLFQLW